MSSSLNKNKKIKKIIIIKKKQYLPTKGIKIEQVKMVSRAIK